MSTLTAEQRDRIAYSTDPLDHQGMVKSIARAYYGLGLDWDDLVGCGNVGLLEAGRRYDPSRGVKFNTYATYWVRQAIGRALVESQWPIRVPEHAAMAMRRVDRGEDRPGMEEAIRLARAATGTCSSPDWLDDLAADPGEDADLDLDLDRLPALLEAISPRHRVVLERRYGLRGRPVQSYWKIGTIVGRGRERIRQIEVEALEQLHFMARERTS